MKAVATRLTRKGQVTIPAEIRARLGLKPRDAVLFTLEDGVVILKPAGSKVARHYGLVTPPPRPVDVRAEREAFEQGVAEEVRKETTPH